MRREGKCGGGEGARVERNGGNWEGRRKKSEKTITGKSKGKGWLKGNGKGGKRQRTKR